jgi:mRNA-degrading endonuclease RelE of RelBE toxin-antitoxin system
VTPHEHAFLQSGETEFYQLPARLQRQFREKLPFLVRNPFKSYPWLRVRQGARHPGQWRFHLGEFRVFYRVDGQSIVFTCIVRRPLAYPIRPPKRLR